MNLAEKYKEVNYSTIKYIVGCVCQKGPNIKKDALFEMLQKEYDQAERMVQLMIERALEISVDSNPIEGGAMKQCLFKERRGYFAILNLLTIYHTEKRQHN